MRAIRTVGLAVLLAGCPARREDGGKAEAPAGDPAAASSATRVDAGAAAPSSDDAESRHHVVFADRTRQAYLLLLDEPEPSVPTRRDLVVLAQRELHSDAIVPELHDLVQLIEREPPPPGFTGLPEAERARLMQEDLLGLHIELLPVAPSGEEPLINPDLLTHEVLARELTSAERSSLPRRRWALLLRADYRNQQAVRGLRLLQTLVRLVAIERGALIHDPDTGETMGPEAFTRRRLQAKLGNVADQIVVIPFPDRSREGSFVRLSTRGMRRFGSVDLELDGLPGDPAVLAGATHLLVGLARRMVVDGEYDAGGYAVEVDDPIVLSRTDVEAAYAGRDEPLAPCLDCAPSVSLHLVERAAEPTDPQDHVVARIVAPRAVSDALDYDHPAWVRRVVAELLGLP